MFLLLAVVNLRYEDEITSTVLIFTPCLITVCLMERILWLVGRETNRLDYREAVKSAQNSPSLRWDVGGHLVGAWQCSILLSISQCPCKRLHQ